MYSSTRHVLWKRTTDVRDGRYYKVIEREAEAGGGGGAGKGGWEIFEPLEFFWLTFPL